METQDNNTQKTKQPRKVPTEIEYLEKGQWTKGDNIITVFGGLPGEEKRPIGYVTLIDYSEDKKPVLAAVDLEGQEIFERTSNLYQLKKQFKEQEARLTKAMLVHENPGATHEHEEPAPEIAPVEGEQKKENDLTATRRRATKNNSQTISH